MQDKQHSLNNTKDNTIRGYKICAGKGCNKIGNNRLKVVFIDKFGSFCNDCKEDLIRSGLIEEDKHALS